VNRISIRIIGTVLFTVLHINAFGMNPSLMPLELHRKTFHYLNLRWQDQLRGTCRYWKKIGDSRDFPIYLIDLLHSNSNTTQETKSRILLTAIYHNNYDLAETILKSVPITSRLYYSSFYQAERFDPYHLAQSGGDNDMLALLQSYKYDIPQYGRDSYGQAIEHSKLPKSKILIELIISSISGDRDSITTIVNQKFKDPQFLPELSEKEGDKYVWSNESAFAIENAFSIIVRHDDHKNITSVIQFLNDNPKITWWLDDFLQRACKFESVVVFEKLLEQKKDKDINKVQTVRDYGSDTTATLRYRTFKNTILGINWDSDSDILSKNPDYYRTIETLLNKYGAKTYEELQDPEGTLKQQKSFFVRSFYANDIITFSKIVISYAYCHHKKWFYIIPASVLTFFLGYRFLKE
jgi:hypothetical protein